MMKPTETLPSNYLLYRSIDLSKEKTLLIGLNIAGVLLFPFIGWLFFAIARIIVQNKDPLPIGSFTGICLLDVFLILVVAGGFVILHESIHGLFFWFYTGQKPAFGFKGAYAYAAQPGWYFPRNHYLWIGLSPFLVITLLGFLLIPMLPPSSIYLVLFGMIFNAVGSVGDFYVVGWLLLQSPKCYINDHGDSMNVYRPQ